MIVVLYRWRLKDGMEKQFIDSWAELTRYLMENFDSLGSRLHIGNDGIYYAYAQWNSLADREKAFAESIELPAGATMQMAIAERWDPVVLDIVSDHLINSHE